MRNMKQRQRNEKGLWEKPGCILLPDSAATMRGGTSSANSHGIAKSIRRAISSWQKAIINKNPYCGWMPEFFKMSAECVCRRAGTTDEEQRGEWQGHGDRRTMHWWGPGHGDRAECSAGVQQSTPPRPAPRSRAKRSQRRRCNLMGTVHLKFVG